MFSGGQVYITEIILHLQGQILRNQKTQGKKNRCNFTTQNKMQQFVFVRIGALWASHGPGAQAYRLGCLYGLR